MLRIGKLTDYGLVVLNQLAKAGAMKLSTDDIAQATGLTVATVRKVMKAIVDAGLVIAQRGSKGGLSYCTCASANQCIRCSAGFRRAYFINRMQC